MAGSALRGNDGRRTRVRRALALAAALWLAVPAAHADDGMIVIPGRGETAETALAHANAASGGQFGGNAGTAAGAGMAMAGGVTGVAGATGVAGVTGAAAAGYAAQPASSMVVTSFTRLLLASSTVLACHGVKPPAALTSAGVRPGLPAWALSSPRYAYCMMCLRFDVDRSGWVRVASGHEHDIGGKPGGKWAEGVTGRQGRDGTGGFKLKKRTPIANLFDWRAVDLERLDVALDDKALAFIECLRTTILDEHPQRHPDMPCVMQRTARMVDQRRADSLAAMRRMQVDRFDFAPGRVLVGVACRTIGNPASRLAFLQQQVAGLPGKTTATVAAAFPRGLAACTTLEPFLPTGARLWGRTTVGVRCAGERPWTVYLQAKVAVQATYYVAARQIAPGEPLSAADLVARDGDLTVLPLAVITDPAQAVGATALVRISAGLPLRQDLLKSPASVSAGQTVRVVAAGPGFTISAEGSALANAAPGQSVRVRMAAGQIVTAIVKDAGTVEIPL
ncbi:flagellar basal body P-ring biosynthesis protein FlgA [Burkholderia cepacia GG4]|uniref:Flagellar basal body P-ring biosynthesis protein FlgA n=2 Tax=Burkholderia TaxID=32008 RepID=A0A9W3JX16_BURCE|nr:flagellar basal body P-ring biosynthesis protein FlgA [Burkholderia cepacia GG4]